MAAPWRIDADLVDRLTPEQTLDLMDVCWDALNDEQKNRFAVDHRNELEELIENNPE